MSLSFKALILAAGMGTRMKSKTPKVLHEVLGIPMVAHPAHIAETCGADELAVVVGHGREEVERALRARISEGLTFHVQHEMLGTADAVKAAWPAFERYDGAVLILYGDVPNLPLETVQKLIEMHERGTSPITMLTAISPGDGDYGRIVRDEVGAAKKIVEYKDASPLERALREVNIGVYLVDAPFLREGLSKLGSANAQNEFYLTDLIEMAYTSGTPTEVLIGDDIEALHGVNTRAQLARADRYARARRNEALMLSGVTMVDPATTYVGFDAVVGRDVFFEPGVMVEGKTYPLEVEKISEHVAASYYDGGPRAFSQGETRPHPHKEGAYSWIKAPRYDGYPMETGPLSRVYLTPEGRKRLVARLKELGHGPEAAFSTMGRHLARAVEAEMLLEFLPRALESLDLQGPTIRMINPETPITGEGLGLSNAARGELLHYVATKEGRIVKYQCVVPSTWNFSPRDERGLLGPAEKAIVGTPVAYKEGLIEVGRVIRSFDPCLACSIH